MDRFLSRSPSTWRTHDSFIRSFSSKSFTDKKSTPKPIDRRRSIRDETLLKIFSSQPDQPLNDENLNPAFLFRALSAPEKAPVATPSSNRKSPIVVGATTSRTDFDDDDGNQLEQQQQNCQSVVERIAIGSSELIEVDKSGVSMTPPSEKRPAIGADNVFAKDKALQLRLQRDLNSPSANARIRAIKALKDPVNAALYANFDVPHEEQDIITTEERHRPKSIQEVMKDVIVYVEVRTGEDNRSTGVKKVISQLGAKVNDKFLRDTTHVVFKDGLQSTYNKAKKWNIPVVSILWIEACKKHMILMNPLNYKISNYERYENPEFYSKIKRQKSMQPDAEENIRRNKMKSAMAKQETENKKAVKTISIPRKPKDNLGPMFADFQEKLLNTPELSEDIGLDLNSKLLENIRNSPFSKNSVKNGKSNRKSSKTSTILEVTDDAKEDNSDDDFEIKKPLVKTPLANARKTLNFQRNPSISATKRRSIAAPTAVPTTPTSTKKSTSKSRQSTLPPSDTHCRGSLFMSSAKVQISGNVSVTAAGKTTVSQSPHITRRSISFSMEPNRASVTVTAAASLKKTVIMEESCDIDDASDNNNVSEKQRKSAEKRRDTTFADVQLDSTRNESKIDAAPVKTPSKSNRRQTQYSPQSMEKTCQPAAAEVTRSTHRRRTCFNFGTKLSSPAASKPAEKLAEKTVDEPILISDNCPPSIRKSVRRRTMFTTPSNCQDKSNDGANNTIRKADYTKLSQIATDTPNPCHTGTKKPTTLLEELNSSLTYSSTKTPVGRRRTIFEASLDIIEQRVKNINRSAKLTQLGINVEDNLTTEKPPTIQNDSEKAVHHTTCETFETNLNKDDDKTSTRVVETPTTRVPPKKRKLFAPNDLILTPTGKDRHLDDDDNNLNDGNIRKKAKTESKTIKTVQRTQQNRRSTLDFEALEKFKKTIQLSQPIEPIVKYLVCTNMHTEQLNCVKQTIAELGGFVLENTVSDKTTHVVSLEPRRTFNLLRGMIRGLWILNYDWVLESLDSGKWLFEEPYEMTNFSRAVGMCRSQRQAFGPKFKNDLFTDVGTIFVSQESNVPSSNLEELIELCSGHVVKDKTAAKYILGESLRNNPNKICLNPLWILDSIQENKIKKTLRYNLE